MKRGQTNLNFLTAIIKPSGITSHDLIYQIREITGEGRIGHMGTLDPLASGVMLIGVGSAARLNNYLEAADKTYLVSAEFGKSTNTYDAEGEVTQISDIPEKISDINFAREYVKNLVGVHKQKPPAYSAIKIDGKPAYKSARSGQEIDLPEREIEIYSSEIVEVTNNSWKFKVCVSKGTYIRSLVYDIGKDLGCGAFVCKLERTAIGEVSINDSYTIEGFANAFSQSNYQVLNVADLLGYPVVEADEKMMKRVKNGNTLRNDSQWNMFPGSKISIVKDGKLLAIYTMEDLHTLICECKFSGPITLPKLEKYCATIGVFDGYHEGHAYEVSECIQDASLRKVKAVVITFDIDPDEIFTENFLKLSTNEERIAKLKFSGVDEVRVLNFEDIKNLSGEEFLDKYFDKNPPLSIHVGEGFKFGKNQSGDTDLLIKWGKEHGVDVIVHELLKKNGEVISSTRLREGL